MGRRAAGRQGEPAPEGGAGVLRLVFAGTPAAALPSLRALLASGHEVVAVVTRPDAAAGRGRQSRRSPVGALADSAGIEVLTPDRPRSPEFLARLAELAPDCCPVVAYGALVPRAALEVPRHGWVNLHFSLLPAWRGAAPVQAAVLHGDEVTGASTFLLEEGLDTGPVYGVVTETVRPRDTAGDLLGRLAESGARLLVATLDGIAAGTLQPRPQPADGVSLAPKITVDDARVDWTAPAVRVDRLVRACTPAPGAWTTLGPDRLKLGPVLPVPGGLPGLDRPGRGLPGSGLPGSGLPGIVPAGLPGELPVLEPGELLVEKRRVLVGTGTGPVELGDVQAPGKRAMPAADWARGLRLSPGTRLGADPHPAPPTAAAAAPAAPARATGPASAADTGPASSSRPGAGSDPGPGAGPDAGGTPRTGSGAGRETGDGIGSGSGAGEDA